ncbi:hypothetical protein pb186bvf_007961 [Paramecium bursaria]
MATVNTSFGVISDFFFETQTLNESYITCYHEFVASPVGIFLEVIDYFTLQQSNFNTTKTGLENQHQVYTQQQWIFVDYYYYCKSHQYSIVNHRFFHLINIVSTAQYQVTGNLKQKGTLQLFNQKILYIQNILGVYQNQIIQVKNYQKQFQIDGNAINQTNIKIYFLGLHPPKIKFLINKIQVLEAFLNQSKSIIYIPLNHQRRVINRTSKNPRYESSFKIANQIEEGYEKCSQIFGKFKIPQQRMIRIKLSGLLKIYIYVHYRMNNFKDLIGLKSMHINCVQIYQDTFIFLKSDIIIKIKTLDWKKIEDLKCIQLIFHSMISFTWLFSNRFLEGVGISAFCAHKYYNLTIIKIPQYINQQKETINLLGIGSYQQLQSVQQLQFQLDGISITEIKVKKKNHISNIRKKIRQKQSQIRKMKIYTQL